MITNKLTGTHVDEVAAGIYRICTPMDVLPGGFTFNSYLIVDEEPLLFHTGLRKLSPITREAIASVIPVDRLRWIGGSHFEGDEFGAMNDLLGAVGEATPFGSEIGVLTSLNDFASRPARGFKDGEEFSAGSRRMMWIDTPHVPHGWESGLLSEERTKTLFCGDLFTQGGAKLPALTEADILEPSEAFRANMDYFSHTKYAGEMLERLAATAPQTLACMHGSAWRGDGAQLLRTLADRLA